MITKKQTKNSKKKTKKNNLILCNLTYNNNIPDKDAIILSCSLFKLNDMYRDITLYINGLKRIIEWIESSKYKIHLYIYYDHSIENDKLFIELKPILDTKKYITTCKYYCDTFIDNNSGLHKGLFGSFVRFYPFFNKSLLKNIKHIIDIDIGLNWLYILENCILNKIIVSKTKCFTFNSIDSKFTYYNLYTNKYTKLLSNAQFYLKNMCLPINLLNDTLIKLRNNDPDILNMVNELINKKKAKLDTLNKNNIFYTNYIKFKDYKTFTYGIDEWWFNNIVLDYIIKKEKEIGIIYIHDTLPKYFNNKIIDWKLSKKSNIDNFFKALLKSKYNKNFYINLKTLYKIVNFDNYHTINEFKVYIKLINNLFSLIKYYKENKLLIINENYLNDLQTHIDYKYNCYTKLETYNTKKDKDLFNYLCQNTDIPILKFNI